MGPKRIYGIEAALAPGRTTPENERRKEFFLAWKRHDAARRGFDKAIKARLRTPNNTR